MTQSQIMVLCILVDPSLWRNSYWDIEVDPNIIVWVHKYRDALLDRQSQSNHDHNNNFCGMSKNTPKLIIVRMIPSLTIPITIHTINERQHVEIEDYLQGYQTEHTMLGVLLQSSLEIKKDRVPTHLQIIKTYNREQRCQTSESAEFVPDLDRLVCEVWRYLFLLFFF